MRFVIHLILLTFALPLAAQDIDAGKALFLSRCAACHDATAQGDGPMAALISIPVPNLTQLAARNGGAFPRVPVVQTIDGRPLLRGHGGDGPMPVFGPILGGGSAVLDGPDGSVIETKGDVVNIMLYLESIQTQVN